MSILIKYSPIAFLILNVTSSWSLPTTLSNTDKLSQDLQQAFDKEQHDDYLKLKNTQNNLSDKDRSKSLQTNAYWLVNRKEDLWIGFFDGKYIKTPKNTYPDVPVEGYQPQQVVRVKNGIKTSQFILSAGSTNYPPRCMNRSSAILDDTLNYIYFYSGCTSYNVDPNTKKHNGYYDVFFYSKKFDTLLKLDSFSYSSINDIFSISKSVAPKNDYYEYSGSDGAFKITGKGKVISINVETGKPEQKIQETDTTTGKKVIIDNPDAYQPVVLERLFEVMPDK